jgi:uncharacterized protein (DUF885 family)
MARQVSFEALTSLIQELTKDKPNQTRVKKLMQENGLEYTNDSIQQMSTVLGMMSNLPVEIKKRKAKETKEKAPEL